MGVRWLARFSPETRASYRATTETPAHTFAIWCARTKDQRDQAVLRVRALVEEGLASGHAREDTEEDGQELLAIACRQID